MDNGQSESVCATLLQSHYTSLVNEVQKNGIERAISNRMKGASIASIENVEKDIKAMQEIAARRGLTL